MPFVGLFDRRRETQAAFALRHAALDRWAVEHVLLDWCGVFGQPSCSCQSIRGEY
jgi:hypothetical protein